MKRFSAFAIVAAFSIWSLLFATQIGQQSQQEEKKIEEEQARPVGQAAIRVAVDQIRVDVTVRDKRGNLITGLQREHFTVYEDKVKQEITFFEPVDGPMTAVLITEYSNVLPWQLLYEAWLGSYSFVDQMKKGDYLAAIAYDIRPEILADFTDNKMEVYNALRRLNYPGFSESNLYDTMVDALDRLEEVDGKVAIVLISSGLDTFSKVNLGNMLALVKQSNVVIYSVGLGGNLRARYEHLMPSMTRLNFLQGDSTLKAMAKFTGGEAFFPRFETQFSGIFGTIATLLRNQYAMGYISSNPRQDGKYRKILVEVTADVDGDGQPDKLKVGHREGYLTPKS